MLDRVLPWSDVVPTLHGKRTYMGRVQEWLEVKLCGPQNKALSWGSWAGGCLAEEAGRGVGDRCRAWAGGEVEGRQWADSLQGHRQRCGWGWPRTRATGRVRLRLTSWRPKAAPPSAVS